MRSRFLLAAVPLLLVGCGAMPEHGGHATPTDDRFAIHEETAVPGAFAFTIREGEKETLDVPVILQ